MTIEELILKGEELKTSIYFYRDNRLYKEYKSNEEEKYQSWLSSVKRIIDTKYKSSIGRLRPYENHISPENHIKILGILEGIKNFPDEPESTNSNKEQGFNINISQTQNQQTSVSINLIIEAFQDELNGNQRKEIQTIIDDKGLEPEKKKSKIVETLKKFGGDIASNILANILTNPSFFGF